MGTRLGETSKTINECDKWVSEYYNWDILKKKTIALAVTKDFLGALRFKKFVKKNVHPFFYYRPHLWFMENLLC